MSIGVGWGATLYESLQTLAPRELENVQVISLLGGIVQARRYNPSEFAWQFARMVGADCYLLAAPAVVDSAETREALIERCGLRDVLRRAERLDMAVLSVGVTAPDSTVVPARFHLAFAATSREQVDRFHAAAVASGGTDDGPPGIRESYNPGYYAAFVKDPDGHRLEAVLHENIVARG